VLAILATLRRAILESADRGAPRNTLAKLHRRLDREIVRMASELLRRTVEESHRILRDVSHDIRSPLNSVLFLADTLLSGHSGELTDVQRRQLGVLYTAAVTLVGLVNDVIDSARLQSGDEIPVSHVSFSIESVLSDVENLVAPLATHRGVNLRFHIETLGPRSGDRQLLSRVLLNLVTNAAKAAEEGGEVHVRVAEPRTGWMRVEVSDDGPGEGLDQLRSLIEDRTAQTYPARHGVGWTHGLGLAICARLVHATGGAIEVEDAAGRGTCFRIELPFPRV
jgi:signal transduction histidine kinase